MSIRDKLDALRARFKCEDPADVSPALLEAIEQLVAAEIRGRPFKPGDIAPAFALPDSNGSLVFSAELLRRGPLVVTFYRGLWCPYCQRDLQGLQAAMPDISSAAASVVAISHRVASGDSLMLQQNNTISFPVLEDDTGDVAVQFGIRWSPDDLRLIEERLGTDLIAFRGTEPWISPMQARFIIGGDNVIAFAEVAFDYSQRSEPMEILPILDRLKRTP